MALRMAKLDRTKTGLWTARKVIPKDVRDAYGKHEEKPTWPSTLTQGQARAEFGVWLASIEERIAALRSASGGPEIALTQRQSRALAGKWYKALVEQESDNPGDPLGWEEALTQLYPEEDDTSYQAYLRGDTVPYDGPWRPTPFLIAERNRLLTTEGLNVTPAASARLLADMGDLYVSFCHLMARRARGDYGADPVVIALPDCEAPAQVSPPTSAGQNIMDLFDGYVAEENPSPATVKAWKPIMVHLGVFLGHTDSERVTTDDLIRWKDHLLVTPTKNGSPRSAKTVKDSYVAAAKAVFNWAKRNRKIPENPAVGIVVGGRKKQRLRDPGLSNDEAGIILRATLEPQAGLSPGHVAARRWVPWLCAYSGARVNEITQLRKQDIEKRDGVWAMHITPEAGSVKTGEARWVPIHSHLIDQGFLSFVDNAAAGPLFYNPKRHRGGSDGNPQYKKVGERLAKWVRELGVDDPKVQPNHGWRHRFKTVARGAKMDPEAREVIPGHAPATEGQAYGTWPLAQLAEEIEKLPRYAL